MQVSKINNINFSGIKLPKSDFEYTKKVRDALKMRGINVRGYKKYYVNNDFNSKRRVFDYIRKKNNFKIDECGVIIFPWSQEAWIVADEYHEQVLKKILNKMEIETELNMLY